MAVDAVELAIEFPRNRVQQQFIVICAETEGIDTDKQVEALHLLPDKLGDFGMGVSIGVLTVTEEENLGYFLVEFDFFDHLEGPLEPLHYIGGAFGGNVGQGLLNQLFVFLGDFDQGNLDFGIARERNEGKAIKGL